jgi:hypothetical protein
MIKVLYIVMLGLGVAAINNGCVTQDKKSIDQEVAIGGTQCGDHVCTGKTFCCNASCGICAPIGGGCTQQACLTAEDSAGDEPAAEEVVSTPAPESEQLIGFPQPCGKVTCTGGTHCCNASCGVCVGPGGECTQQICLPTD